jgi:predicted ArsR family transcriptional regulator
MHDNQKKILDFLLEHPDGATLDEIAAYLEMTKSAAKEHLLKVEALGYITYKDTKGPVGRPRRRYLLSPDGHEAFPKQYSWLSNVLLEILARDMGRDSVIKLMHSLADQVAGSMKEKFSDTASVAERLAKITAVMNDLGYRSSLKQSDLRKGAVIEATNCVYHSVAKRHPDLCRFDVRFLENASGLDVKLETCIARGGNVCRFCLRKPKA